MAEPREAEAFAPEEEIRAELDRALASQALAGSDQLKRLLRTVVERAIHGQSDLLKEYNLGLDVFQRPPDYDPKVDPIVRVQARRLRSKLGEYYAGEGADSTLIIHIPKGGYVPMFDRRATNLTAAADADRVARPGGAHRRIWLAAAAVGIFALVLLAAIASRDHAATPDLERSIAVLPLKNFTGDTSRSWLADQATEMLTTELAKNRALRVLSRTTASTYRDTSRSLPEVAGSMGVRWIVEGGLGAEGDRIYLKLRAVDALTDRKVWADVYDCELREMAHVSARAAASMASAIEAQIRSKD